MDRCGLASVRDRAELGRKLGRAVEDLELVAIAHLACVHGGARLAQRDGFVDAILQKLDSPRAPASLGRDHSFGDRGRQLFYAR